MHLYSSLANQGVLVSVMDPDKISLPMISAAAFRGSAAVDACLACVARACVRASLATCLACQIAHSIEAA